MLHVISAGDVIVMNHSLMTSSLNYTSFSVLYSDWLMKVSVRDPWGKSFRSNVISEYEVKIINYYYPLSI